MLIQRLGQTQYETASFANAIKRAFPLHLVPFLHWNWNKSYHASGSEITV